MYTFLVLILISDIQDDLNKFPTRYIARTQIDIIDYHIKYLKYMSLHNPNDGSFDLWIEESKFIKRYWELLWLAKDYTNSEEYRFERLQNLHDLIGPELFYKYWHPIILNEKEMPKIEALKCK